MWSERRRTTPILAALLLALLTASGCGSKRFDVAGRVTCNGSILDRPDGRVTGVVAGLNKIVVYYPNPKLRKAKEAKLKPGERLPPTEPAFLTPERYGLPETSGLELNVEKSTEYNIDLIGPVKK
jgi:hypothetical protein